jgi:hypothetical protein
LVPLLQVRNNGTDRGIFSAAWTQEA